MKYEPEIVEALLDSLRDDGSVEIACRRAGIRKKTFYEWQKDPKKSDFSDAVRKTRAEFRQNQAWKLEVSLYRRACGYDYTEEKTVWKMNPETKQLYIHSKIITSKHEVPDVKAIIFALCNLVPKKWGVNRTTEIEIMKPKGEFDEEDFMKYLTKEEIHFLAEIMLKVENAKKKERKENEHEA